MSQKIQKAWHRFLQSNFNVFMRSTPELYKERKYQHLDIQNKFNEIEKQRKKQRMALISYKKQVKQKIVETQLRILDKSQKSDIYDSNKFESIENYLSSYNLSHLLNPSQEEEKVLLKELKSHFLMKREKLDLVISLEDENTRLKNDLEQLDKEQKELKYLDDEIEKTESELVIVTGMKKKILQSGIRYLHFQHRNNLGVVFSPEQEQNIEKVHHLIEHNLPIDRLLLYETMPDFFQQDIAKLDKQIQRSIRNKCPKILTHESNTLQVFSHEGTSPAIENLDDPDQEHEMEKLIREEYEFMDFVHNKCISFYNRHLDHFEMKKEKGYHSISYMLTNIEVRNYELLTDQEKLIHSDMQELKQLQSDYLALQKLNRQKKVQFSKAFWMPKFIRQSKNYKLKEFWVQRHKELVQDMGNIKDSLFIPEAHARSKESLLDKVISDKRKSDVDQLLEESKKEFELKFGGEEPIEAPDRRNKDENLVRKLGAMVDIMHDLPEFEEQRRLEIEEDKQKPILESNRLSYMKSSQFSKLPLSGLMNIEDLPKVLQLNNNDPKKYDLEFFAEHFNIYPNKLRNIFNFIGYPIVGENGQVQEMLRFIYYVDKRDGLLIENNQDDI